LVEDIRRRYPKEHDRWLEDPGKYPPPGGETVYDVEKRARAVVDEICTFSSSPIRRLFE
jgi:broad specificity phosphatase PhoE